MTTWTPELLITISGIAVSLLFAYFPVVKDWFAGLDDRWKPLVNLFTLLAITLIRVLYVCKVDWECIKLEAPMALAAFIAAIVTNQATFQVLVKQFKRASRLKAAKAAQAAKK